MGKYKGFKGSGMTKTYKNQPTYVLTNSEMANIVEKEVQKRVADIKNEISAVTVHKFWDIYLTIILNICHSKFNFDEREMRKFKYWFEFYLDSIVQDYISVQDLRQELTDMDIDIEDIMSRKITEFETIDPEEMEENA